MSTGTTTDNAGTQFDVAGFEGVDIPQFGESGFDEPSYAIDGFEDMDVSGVKGSDIANRGLAIDRTGLYHLGLDVEERFDKYKNGKDGAVDMTKPIWPGLNIRLTVLATSPGLSPVGSVMFHEVRLVGKGGAGPLEDWARKASNAFLVGCGVLNLIGDQIIDPETGTTKVKSSTLAARLRKIGQIVGLVKMSKATTDYPEPKPEFPFGQGAYPVTDPKVAHVPKNLEALKAAGIELPTAAAKPATHL